MPDFGAWTDALYGGGYHGHISEFGQQGKNFSRMGSARGDVGDFTVQVVKQFLGQMYPDATPEQLNAAAYKALTVNDPNAPAIIHRADQQKDVTAQILRDGSYAYDGRVTPDSIVRRIGYFMGGLPEGSEQAINQWATDHRDELVQMNNAVRASDGQPLIKQIAPLALGAIGTYFGAPMLGEALGLGGTAAGAAAGGLSSTVGTKLLYDTPIGVKSALPGAAVGAFMGSNGLVNSAAEAPAQAAFPQGSTDWTTALPKVDTGLGSGMYGQLGAIDQGMAGMDYLSPMASGSITGVSGMSSITPSALAEFAAQTGLNTNGLALASGVGGTAAEPSLWDRIQDQITPKDAINLAKGLLSPQSPVAGSSGMGGLLGGGSSSWQPIDPYYHQKTYGTLKRN